MPAQTSRIENVTFQFDEPHRTKAELPKSTRWVKKIDVRYESRRLDAARHREAAVEQRPVESFAVESHKYWSFGDARGEFVQQRIFFRKVAHEKLLDLQRAGIPPGQPDQKCVRPCAAGKACGFRVEEEPLGRILQCVASVFEERRVTRAREKLDRDGGWLERLRRREPVAQNEVLAETISGDSCADEASDRIFLIRLAKRV